VSTPHPDALEEKLADPSSCQHQDSAYFDTFVAPDAASLLLAADAGLLRGAYAGLPPADVDVYLKTLGSEAAMAAALDWYRANIQDRKFTTPALGKVDADAHFCLDTAEASRDFMSGPYRFVRLPGVSHWVPEAAPDALTDAILAIARQDGG